MKFPQDLLRFLYWVFFKPFSLRAWINQVDPAIKNAQSLFTRAPRRAAAPLRSLALFYIIVVPVLLGFGTALIMSGMGLSVNWLELVLYLALVIALSSSFSIGLCIAFLLPFSVVIAVFSGNAFTPAWGLLFSFFLGLAYGLYNNSAGWGLIAGIVYGIVLGLLAGPLGGLVIAVAFLAGYFRIVLYLIEAPLSWILGTLAPRRDAIKLWRLQPLRWDELIWFPLPGLDRHLQALKAQDPDAYQDAVRLVKDSFRQGWAASGASKSDR